MKKFTLAIMLTLLLSLWVTLIQAQTVNQGAKSIAAKDTSKVTLNPQEAQKYYISGKKKYAENDLLNALAELTLAEVINPKLYQAWVLTGRILLDIGNAEKAIEDFNKAIEINPQYIDSYYYRSRAYAASKEYEKALTDLEKVILMNPKYTKAYALRGMVYGASNNIDKACADWKMAVKLGDTTSIEYVNEYCKNEFVGHIAEISTYPAMLITGDCPLSAICEIRLKEFEHIVFKISEADLIKYGLIENTKRLTEAKAGNGYVLSPNDDATVKILAKGWKVKLTAQLCHNYNTTKYMLVSSCKRILQNPPSKK